MTPTSHVLIVDDDNELRALLSKFVAQHGYRVSAARDGKAMMQIINGERVNLVVLDVMLPGENGFHLCRRLRAANTVPIIMLTARREETDRIVGLEMGADDYLTKPFNPRELLARVRAVLRRTGTPPDELLAGRGRVLEFSGWRLDVTGRRLLSPAGTLVSLRAGEFDLLLAFALRARRVLSREQLLDLSRGRTANSFERSVDMQVSRLRRKIEVDPRQPALIKTVRGGGYLFATAVTATGLEDRGESGGRLSYRAGSRA